MSALCFSCIVHNLNSIMILLIQLSHLHNWFRVLQFKFHYDSINSHLAWPAPIPLAKFKFHYDSINSTTGTIYRKLAFIDLNSIMILLIRSSNHSMPIYPNSFKFHYDSINSLIENIKNSQSFNLNSIMILLIRINKELERLWKKI